MRSGVTVLGIWAGVLALAGCAPCREPELANCGPNCHATGCDNSTTRTEARVRARQALECCGRQVSCHFAEGFEMAYVDVVEGSDGTPPGVPPERYWNKPFRSRAGHARAEEWYAGYYAGMNSALGEGLGEFNAIPTALTATPQEAQLPSW